MNVPSRSDPATALVVTIALVTLSTLAGLAIAPHWGVASVDLLFLPAVLASAVLYGRWPALLAAVLSALAYNFFYTAPFHSLWISRPEDLQTVTVLLAVAIVVSQLAAALRSQARLALVNAERHAIVAGFARKLLSCAGVEAIAKAAVDELARLFGCNAILLSPDVANPRVLARHPGGAPLTPSDLAAAAIAIETGEPTGRGARRLDPADWLFHPVRTDKATLAAAGLARDDGERAVEPHREPLLVSLLDQVALALARAALETELRHLNGVAERDRLRGALLQSVGHDLRTPLTAVAAATAELRVHPGDPQLLDAIEGETATLRRYIGNLLDMARIEAGGVPVRHEAIDLVDAVNAAMRDIVRRPEAARAPVEMPPDLPFVIADPDLLHHILINLFDNAVRHGGGVTRVEAARDGAAVTLSVVDGGDGLTQDAAAVFTRFGRLAGSDRTGGAGLGLAIVKSFADAMGIDVTAGNSACRGGVCFTLRFPSTIPFPEGPHASQTA